MPRMMDWCENGLESSTKVVTTCMTSRGAACRLWLQALMFYEKGYRQWGPVMINALIMVETM